MIIYTYMMVCRITGASRIVHYRAKRSSRTGRKYNFILIKASCEHD